MGIERFYDFVGKTGQKFEHYSKFCPVPLNLKNLLFFGLFAFCMCNFPTGETAPASKSFEFLKYELPVRLANIMQEIKLLPPTLKQNSAIKQVFNMYENSFETFLKYEYMSSKKRSVISDFTEDINNITKRHSNVVETMASGIREEQKKKSWTEVEEEYLQYFLDRFYISRIGLRTLLNQHLLIYGPVLHDEKSYIGNINPECSPLELAINAYTYSRLLCTRIYGYAPGCDIEICDQLNQKKSNDIDLSIDLEGNMRGKCNSIRINNNNNDQTKCIDLTIKGPNITFCYLPNHLFYMLYELMKNSMRAVIESHLSDLKQLPRIHIFISNSPEDVIIKITDYGAGMPLRIAEHVFRYHFTTASEFHNNKDGNVSNIFQNISNNNNNGKFCSLDDGVIIPSNKLQFSTETNFSPLAGRGYGLPLSRLYAQYLGGNLKLYSIDGVGTTAIIYLKRKPETANELLPIFNHTSKSVYENPVMERDWITNTQLSIHPDKLISELSTSRLFR